MKALRSDNDTEFVNKVLDDLLEVNVLSDN